MPRNHAETGNPGAKSRVPLGLVPALYGRASRVLNCQLLRGLSVAAYSESSCRRASLAIVVDFDVASSNRGYPQAVRDARKNTDEMGK